MWMRVEDGVCVERTHIDPAGRFRSDAEWVEVPPALAGLAQECVYLAVDGEVAPPSIDHLVEQLLERLAARGEREAAAGVVMLDGYRVDTSERGRTLMLGAFLRAQRLASTVGPDAIIHWKVDRRTFEAAPASVVMERGRAAIDHVQACIDREAIITAAILDAASAEDATWETVLEVYAAEIDAGW